MILEPGGPDLETYVNGELIESKRKLYHSDRLVLGGSHYFRVINPLCKKFGKKKVIVSSIVFSQFLIIEEFSSFFLDYY